ncbi:MAG: LysR family transcriptional regulator [Pirellulaceae bacterium]|nr:LysR family transcriptional regulator [Pirellulaceae bacterium]
MQIKQLKVFCDIAARRSISQGACENDVSQSAASQMVQQLEERLGVKLLDRSQRPLALTSEGAVFYRGCRRIIDRYFALEENVRTLHEDVSGLVRVASIYSVGLSHMNQSVQDFLSRYPKSNLRIEYQHPDRVYDLINRDQAEVGLVSYPQSDRKISATPWRDEPMILACAPHHELTQFRRLPLALLQGRPMVTFTSDLRIRREMDRVLAGAGVEVEIAMEFDNTETIKRAIEINAGVGLLPAPTVQREVASKTLVAIELETPLVRPLGIIQRRGKEQSRTARQFVEFLLHQAQPLVGELGPVAGALAASTVTD